MIRGSIRLLALFVVLYTAIIIALFVTPASSQEAQLCGLRDEVLAKVASTYEEVLQGGGLAADGNKQLTSAVEMYANEETGTWTLLRMTPDGMACLVAYGQFWSAAAAPKKGDPA